MTANAQHSEEKRPTAEDYRQTADAHAQTLKDFWKRFLVSGLFVLAAIAVILASLAWFFSNNRVDATTSTLSAKAARFTLVAQGEGEENAHVGYYERSERTPQEKAELGDLDLADSMTVTVSSNLNNNDAGGVYPGARGVISFSVVPLITSLGDVEVDLSRVLQTKVVESEETNTQLNSLFKNHLLLFRACDKNGFYSNRITDGKITVYKEQFYKEGSTDTTEPVRIDLYWVWPEHLQNYVLVNDALYYKNLFALNEDDSYSEDYTSLQSFINDNKDNFYYGTNTEGVVPADAPDLSPDMAAAEIETCAELYNNADEYIGDRVTYLQLRIAAKEVQS